MATMTPKTFADALLDAIGAPRSSANETFVEEWEAAEGGHWVNTAHYNPLNTTLDEPGATPFKPGAGVKAYTSWSEGLKATVSTLLEAPYRGVVQALQSSDPSEAQVQLEQSPWDAGHYADGFPSPTSAAAYVKAHGGKGGGSFLDSVASDLNPVNDAKKLVGLGTKAAGSVGSDIASGIGAALAPLKNVVVKGLFAAAGLTLVIVGGYQATKPATAKLRAIAPSGPAAEGEAGAGAGAAGDAAALAAV